MHVYLIEVIFFQQAFIEEREAVERMKKSKPQAPLVIKDDSGTATTSQKEEVTL